MTTTFTAKLFKNGASQAVRLPAQFRFQGDEVYISRDEDSGDVILSQKPGVQAWTEFFEQVHAQTAECNFMEERPMNEPPLERNLFAGEAE